MNVLEMPTTAMPSTKPAKNTVPGTIRFVHDASNDIHLAYPNWSIETTEDCGVWYSQYEAYFFRMARKVDAIFVLDEFDVSAQIGPTWGKYRAQMEKRFTRYSVRVRANARVSAFDAASAVIYGVGYEAAGDVAAAILILSEERRRWNA